MTQPTPHDPPPPPTQGMESINHVIILVQENRSFDHYFGQLNEYRRQRGIPEDVDGLPANAWNPDRSGQPIASFHFDTVCSESQSPSWNETHRQWNVKDPASSTGTMDGFVYTAAGFAISRGLNDVGGVRAMGYYTEREIPFYYFMATEFATSDRFFASVPSRTPPNRLYMFSATSAGITDQITQPMKQKTIFQALEEKNIPWRIYTTSGKSFLSAFGSFAQTHLGAVVPYNQLKIDLNSDLPAVSWIEAPGNLGADEHPPSNIQHGAAWVADLVNDVMGSAHWQDTVLLISWDEAGGYYDHVPSPAAPHPDGIQPIDLGVTDTPGDFNRYGFRVPLLVISPFARKHYVSHTTADFTMFLKLIETRFQLSALTARDAAQPDMSEFFDFNEPPWLTPPVPPAQLTTEPCYLNRLP